MICRSEKVRLALTALALLGGNALYSLVVAVFLEPSGLITGGATGIALAVNRLAGLPVSGVMLVINVAMLLVGWALLGRRFALSTLASSFLSPLTLALWERLLAGYVLTQDLLLCALFAGVGIGTALGMVIRVGGSTGGMDIPPPGAAKIFSAAGADYHERDGSDDPAGPGGVQPQGTGAVRHRPGVRLHRRAG